MRHSVSPRVRELLPVPTDMCAGDKEELSARLRKHTYVRDEYQTGELVWLASQKRKLDTGNMHDLAKALYVELLKDSTGRQQLVPVFESSGENLPKIDRIELHFETSKDELAIINQLVKEMPVTYASSDNKVMRIPSLLRIGPLQLEILTEDPIFEVARDASIVSAIRSVGGTTAMKGMRDAELDAVNADIGELKFATLPPLMIGGILSALGIVEFASSVALGGEMLGSGSIAIGLALVSRRAANKRMGNAQRRAMALDY